jgi:hypothetical protein
MIQQGQVFKLKARGADGQPLWAHRYRFEGRGSSRPQVGGFASRAEAQKALRKALERLGPGGRAATTTLAELVEEYLAIHQAEQVTIAKLRWLLGKATVVLGEIRLADLSPKDVYAWRLGIDPLRDLYDLRHTYPTFALRAGVPVFAVSRFMGSSIAMIDHHYGHLAHDSRQHAISLLDALALERAVDAAWTSSHKRTKPLSNRSSSTPRMPSRRVVDARWTPRLVGVASQDNERS